MVITKSEWWSNQGCFFCTHAVPLLRWSHFQLLCILEGNVMPSMTHNLTGALQPCAKYHNPCQPGSWSAALRPSLVTCHAKLVTPWLSCSMDDLSNLAKWSFHRSILLWFMSTTTLLNRWPIIQRKMPSSKIKCRNLSSYWLWPQQWQITLPEKQLVSKDKNNCSL